MIIFMSSSLEHKITTCVLCPRLVQWRQDIGQIKVRRFQDDTYWAKPVAGFGSLQAECLIVGLAPAAHGANRTGRMFTGDRSGEWLYRALAKQGFANQAESNHRKDGLKLHNCFITAVLHCAPPQNKPAKDEITNCRRFFSSEFRQLKRLRVMICLGQIAFKETLFLLESELRIKFTPKPKFSHGNTFKTSRDLTIIGSYHPSQQNTFTGKLTEEMFDTVFRKALHILNKSQD